jgi:hypothetical protein
MIELNLRRRSHRTRAIARWGGLVEELESRIALSNGVVGVDAQISPPAHVFMIDSIPEDSDNDGIISSQSVTFFGHVQRPNRSDFTDSHLRLTIEAIENGTTIGSVTWDTSQKPGPPEFHQDPTLVNKALFQISATLLSSGGAVQNVTFRVTVDPYGSLDAVRTDNTAQPLTATLTVQQAPAGLTVASISPVTSPRTEPVQTLDVTFSQAPNAATFTTADLALTRDGQPVTLGRDVTITQVNDTTFRVGGLQGVTTPIGAYVLTVDASGVEDSAGTAGSGSQTVSFTVQTVPVVTGGPRVANLQRFGFHTQPTMLVLTFDRDLDPARAQDPNNYQVTSPGRDRRIGTSDDVIVPLRSAVYSATARTVMLVTAQRLSVFVTNRLVARGTGAGAVADTSGNLLDGDGNGQAGGDYAATFGREILAGPAINGGTAQGLSNGQLAGSQSDTGTTRSLSKRPAAVGSGRRLKALTSNGSWQVSDGGRYRHYTLKLST